MSEEKKILRIVAWYPLDDNSRIELITTEYDNATTLSEVFSKVESRIMIT